MGGVFENNNQLNSLTFNGSPTKNTLLDIPSHCFYGDSALSGIKYSDDPTHTTTDRIPDSVTYIGDSPFNKSG
jgi:hypothetical protein